MPFTYTVPLGVSRTCLWSHRPWHPTAIQSSQRENRSQSAAVGGGWPGGVEVVVFSQFFWQLRVFPRISFQLAGVFTRVHFGGSLLVNCSQVSWLKDLCKISPICKFYHIFSLGDVGLCLTDSCKKHLTIHPKCFNFKSNVLQRHCGDREPMTRQGTRNLQTAWNVWPFKWSGKPAVCFVFSRDGWFCFFRYSDVFHGSWSLGGELVGTCSAWEFYCTNGRIGVHP